MHPWWINNDSLTHANTNTALCWSGCWFVFNREFVFWDCDWSWSPKEKYLLIFFSCYKSYLIISLTEHKISCFTHQISLLLRTPQSFQTKCEIFWEVQAGSRLWGTVDPRPGCKTNPNTSVGDTKESDALRNSNKHTHSMERAGPETHWSHYSACGQLGEL